MYGRKILLIRHDVLVTKSKIMRRKMICLICLENLHTNIYKILYTYMRTLRIQQNIVIVTLDNTLSKPKPYLDFAELFYFHVPYKGVINRGDSFRRRRSRSNSLAPVSPIHPRLGGGGAGGISGSVGAGINGDYTGAQDEPQEQQPVEVFRVDMLGASGVGKQALIQQFRTSDCINAYDGPGK